MFKRTAIILISIVAVAATASAKSHKHDDDDDSDKRRDCKEVLSDRGNEWVTESGAKSAAEKSWTQSVRFKYGELYSDLANAKDVKFECAKASIGGALKRCEITARPCRTGPEKADKDKDKDKDHDHDHH
jgi:hypothetical protein